MNGLDLTTVFPAGIACQGSFDKAQNYANHLCNKYLVIVSPLLLKW